MNLEDYDFDRLLGLGYTEKATGDLKDACWKGYTAIGTKKKGGRTVPNCVKMGKSDHAEEMKRKPLIAGPSSGSPSFAETLDFARCQRPDGSYYGTSGECRKGSKAGAKEQEIKRDDSKDVKRGSTLIGTSPRNMLVDNIKAFEARLKDARSDAERKFLQDTIDKAKAQLKSEDAGEKGGGDKVKQQEKFIQRAKAAVKKMQAEAQVAQGRLQMGKAEQLNKAIAKLRKKAQNVAVQLEDATGTKGQGKYYIP